MMKNTAIRVGVIYGVVCILLGILVMAVERSDASSDCLSDGDCPADRRFCRQETAEQRWACFATLAQVGQFCVDPDDCDGRRCIDNQCRAPEQDAQQEEGSIVDTAIEIFQEAIARIKSAITFEDEDIGQFLSGPAKTGKAIAIVKSSDKVITAVKQNPKLNKGAIALVRYKNLERLNVCEKISAVKEQTKQEMNCDYSRDKKMHVIKMDVANDLWPSVTQLIQLH